MGFRLYKSVRLGKGVRLNLSKTGVGISAGVPGLRYSVHSSGRTVKTAGIPGTGVYYRKDTYSKTRPRSGGSRSRSVTAPTVQMYPKAGLFAPKEDKLVVSGVTAYMQADHERALGLFRDVARRDEQSRHIGEEFFAGVCLVALNRLDEAVAPFETVIASDEQIPDRLMLKYKVGGMLQVQVTAAITAELPMSTFAVALMLAEVYQRTGRSEKAIELLESLGSVRPDPVLALSLADLYTEADRWDEVVRVSEDFPSNEDDATAQLLMLRANALYELGLDEAVLTVAKEVLRFRKRAPQTLRATRYIRGLTYERRGRKAQARKEYERVYAEDSTFMDVAERLGLGTSSGSVRADQPARPDL